VPIPEDMLEEVKEYRSILIAVADYDENLLENSWKMKTLLQRKKNCIKSSCYGHGYHPDDCWFFFKTKVFNLCWMQFVNT
jgi:hypothetical protein